MRNQRHGSLPRARIAVHRVELFDNMAVAIKSSDEAFTPRQQAVLTAALGLLVEEAIG